MSEQKTEQLQPELVAKKKKQPNWLWRAVVLLPTVITAAYFSLIASDQYVSESSFVVRSANNQTSSAGLGVLLQNVGISRSQDDTYTVQEYMRSRTALEELSKKLPVRSFYEEYGDVFSRFNGFGLGWLDSNEAFYQYYQGKNSIHFDAVSGISTLRVQSFEAQQAHDINQALLEKGEELINRLNDRARTDTVKFSEQTLLAAQEKVKETAADLTAYRVRNGVLDLKEQSAMQLNLLSKLQDELISIQTQLDQVRAVTPDNPQISGLKSREQSLLREINRQTQMMTGGGAKSIAGKVAEYQRLVLENELAEKQLAAAISALETAKAEADRQQLYLEVVSRPSLPDMAQLPQRWYNILAVFVISLMIYGIVRLLSASIREHRN